MNAVVVRCSLVTVGVPDTMQIIVRTELENTHTQRYTHEFPKTLFLVQTHMI